MNTGTVTVLCALPAGLVCELGLDYDNYGRPVQGQQYQRVTLKGANSRLPASQRFHDGRNTTVVPAPNPRGGIAEPGITENVPRAFMEAWLKKNQGLGAVKNKLIVIVEGSIEDSIERMRKARTGFEPVNPDAPPAGISRVV